MNVIAAGQPLRDIAIYLHAGITSCTANMRRQIGLTGDYLRFLVDQRRHRTDFCAGNHHIAIQRLTLRIVAQLHIIGAALLFKTEMINVKSVITIFYHAMQVVNHLVIQDNLRRIEQPVKFRALNRP